MKEGRLPGKRFSKCFLLHDFPIRIQRISTETNFNAILCKFIRSYYITYNFNYNMKKITFPFLAIALSLSAYSQEPAPGTATIEFVSDELSKVINKDAKVEIV